jgi:tripartite-type tricarboxylate transporter receptor subunit TctC
MAENPDFKKQMAIQATEIVLRGPDEFRKVVADSMVQNAVVVKAVGLTAN